MSLVNKVAIVTGASSGIGAAIALKFAEEGAKVALVGRNENKLKNVSENCAKVGPKPLIILGDVSKDNDAKRIVDDTLKHFGKLDILVNNAGIGGRTSILDENTMQVFDMVMNVNLRAVVYLTYLAGKHLIKTKGNIINISSVAALKVFGAGSYPYHTSKAALDHFSRSVALELAPNGVRVNIINPGPVKTEIIENMGMRAEQADAAWDGMKNLTLFGRLSAPVEIAEIALLLASDKAVGITGSSFVTDNGAMLGSFNPSAVVEK